MATGDTMHRFGVALSDVDRGVYQALDLRLARHPSESMRYLLTRAIAYCLSYEEGIAFSKGGLATADEAPLAVHDPTGLLLAWIDVGAPSAERLHKASKAAERVVLYTTADLAYLERDHKTRPIHRIADIEVWRIDAAFLDALEEHVARNTKLELVRSDGQLYATVGGVVIEGAIAEISLDPGA